MACVQRSAQLAPEEILYGASAPSSTPAGDTKRLVEYMTPISRHLILAVGGAVEEDPAGEAVNLGQVCEWIYQNIKQVYDLRPSESFVRFCLQGESKLSYMDSEGQREGQVWKLNQRGQELRQAITRYELVEMREANEQRSCSPKNRS